MSAGTETAYGYLPIPKIIDEFTVLLNYFLIANLLFLLINPNKKYSVCNRKSFNIPKFYFLMFLLTIALQNFLHIERRYYLFYYLLIYFFNSFFVLKILENIKKEEQKISFNYVVYVFVFVCLCYTARQTILYNFVLMN